MGVMWTGGQFSAFGGSLQPPGAEQYDEGAATGQAGGWVAGPGWGMYGRENGSCTGTRVRQAGVQHAQTAGDAGGNVHGSQVELVLRQKWKIGVAEEVEGKGADWQWKSRSGRGASGWVGGGSQLDLPNTV